MQNQLLEISKNERKKAIYYVLSGCCETGEIKLESERVLNKIGCFI